MDAISTGWDGRLGAAVVMLVAGWLPVGYYVAAAALGALFVAESALGWIQAAAANDGEHEERDAG